MPCDEAMEVKLSRYVDGELPEEERSEVAEHLADCASCRSLHELFRKNDSLLSNSLGSDAFGEAVIESVVGKIRGEAPPEAKPVEEGVWEWVRSRPLVQLAAAALLVVGLLLVLDASQSRRRNRLAGRLDEAEKSLASLAEENRELARALQRDTASRRAAYESYERTIEELRLDRYLRGASHGTTIAYVEPRREHLVVRAHFAGKDYRGFHVLRSDADAYERSGRFQTLTREPLSAPLYTDESVKPGRSYVYRFRAILENGRHEDSSPIKMMLDRTAPAPEASIRVFCELVSANRDEAKFILERTVGGKVVTRPFYVRIDDPIGARVDVKGVGPVDFSTGLKLSHIRSGTQPMIVRITEVRTGNDGRPIVDRLEKDAVVPAISQRDDVLHKRENLEAVLQRTGTGDRREIGVWRGSSLRVPVPR